jgi:hypothetical protein
MLSQVKSSKCVAIALARVEGNRERWLKGHHFELRSKRTLLQNWVGNGGTLWVIVSRPGPRGGRHYSLTFRFSNCTSHTHEEAGKWGRYAVLGDEKGSEFYAENDARLLLLALRFENGSPLKSINSIGSSLRTPRRLTRADANLLEIYRPPTDVWAVFLSYSHTDEASAQKLRDALHGEGISVFRDNDTIHLGQDWHKAIQRGVAASRSLVLLIGESTHNSDFVREELANAQRLGMRIIPVSLTGDLGGFPQLAAFQGILHVDDWSDVAAQIAQAIPTVLQASDMTTA